VQAVEVLPEGVRVTLRPVQLDGGAGLGRSLRVRLRAKDPAEPEAGDVIQVRALVQAPSPPAYPGGWDLQRDAFFAGLGGYGFAIGQVQILAHVPVTGLAGRLQALRETIASRFEAVLPGAEGAVAATLLTGVPTAIPMPDREAFRASGLAHLLAVAGLHIGIVMGLAFGASRAALAAWEYAALHWPTKQIAALVALGGAPSRCEGWR
jgi:competence protein ComEC